MLYKFLRSYWLAFVLPGIILAFSFQLKSAVGPFWQYADPSYIYLLNSLNMAKGIPSAFFDQPGFSLQILGQIVILLFNLGQSTANTVNSVLIHPEFYLNAINIVLLLLIPISSICLGIYTYKKSNDIGAVFLAQLPNVFLLTWIAHPGHPGNPTVYATVNAEPLLLVISNLFNLFILKLFFSQDNKEENTAILALGFISGLGIATKLTFLPLLALPVIVARWPMKPAYILASIISFVIWTIPFISLYPSLLSWSSNLLTHTGIYGNGNQGLVDIHHYLAVWQLYIQEFRLFILFALAILGFSLIQMIRKKAKRTILFMGAISFVILVQFACVAKHYDEHYLVLSINSFGALFVIFYLNYISKNALKKNVTLILVSAFVLISLIICSTNASRLAAYTNEIVKFNNDIHSKYPDAVFIGSYLESPIRNQEYALFMGNDSSAGGENEELSRLYPNYFSYFTDTRDISGTCTLGIYHFNKPVWADDLLTQYQHIIFINSGYDFTDTPYMVKPLLEGKYSKSYLLSGSTEKAANEFFNAALKLAQQGSYQDAFSLSLQSRALHYQPKAKIDFLLTEIYGILKH